MIRLWTWAIAAFALAVLVVYVVAHGCAELGAIGERRMRKALRGG